MRVTLDVTNEAERRNWNSSECKKIRKIV